MKYTEAERASLSIQFPTAFVDTPCEIGDGTKIWHYTHVMAHSKIGAACMIGQGAHVGPDVVIGNRCSIQNGVQLFRGVTLEDEVFIGPCAVFTNVLTPRAFVNRKAEFKSTLIKRGASIGANATIVCGVTIGEFAMVGAGAVVTKDVRPFELVYGVPAMHRGFVCRCGEVLQMVRSLQPGDCRVCSSKYEPNLPGAGIQLR